MQYVFIFVGMTGDLVYRFHLLFTKKYPLKYTEWYNEQSQYTAIDRYQIDRR